MKKVLSLVVIMLLAIGFLAAQGNGGGNGSPENGNDNGNGPSVNARQWLITYLQNGNPVPAPLALDVIRKARDWKLQVCGLNLEQTIQKYFQGQLRVEFVAASPPSCTFRVSCGGQAVVVILDSI